MATLKGVDRIRFRCKVGFSATCGRCGVVADLGGDNYYPGSEVYIPSLPDDWLVIGDVPVCPAHVIEVDGIPGGRIELWRQLGTV